MITRAYLKTSMVCVVILRGGFHISSPAHDDPSYKVDHGDTRTYKYADIIDDDQNFTLEARIDSRGQDPPSGCKFA